VDTGGLYRQITYEREGDFAVVVGIKMIHQSSGVNIALVLHEGTEPGNIDTYKNPKVRRYIFARLHEAAPGWVPTPGAGTSGHKGIWGIPPRPFIAQVLEDEAFGKFVLDQWEWAFKKSMLEC